MLSRKVKRLEKESRTSLWENVGLLSSELHMPTPQSKEYPWDPQDIKKNFVRLCNTLQKSQYSPTQALCKVTLSGIQVKI